MEIVRIAADGAAPHGRPGGGEPAERLPLVLVTWRDAWFDFEEADGIESRPDYLVSTVGFVIRQGPRFLSIAQELLPDGDGFRAVTHIPLAVIESVQPLLLTEDHVPAAATGDVLYSADADAAGASDLGRRDA